MKIVENRPVFGGTHVANPDGVDSLKPGVIPDPIPADARPVQDEWGIYDPEQAGLEAVLRKLAPEKTEPSDVSTPDPSDT